MFVTTPTPDAADGDEIETPATHTSHLASQIAMAAPDIVKDLGQLKEMVLPGGDTAGIGSMVIGAITEAVGETVMGIAGPIGKIISIAWKVRNAIKAAREKAVAEITDTYKTIAETCWACVDDRSGKESKDTQRIAQIMSGRVEGTKIDKNDTPDEQRAALLNVIRLLGGLKELNSMKTQLQTASVEMVNMGKILTVLTHADDNAEVMHEKAIELQQQPDQDSTADVLNGALVALEESIIETAEPADELPTESTPPKRTQLKVANSMGSGVTRATTTPHVADQLDSGIAGTTTMLHDALTIESAPEQDQPQLQREFESIVRKITALAGRELKTKSESSDHPTHDLLSRIQIHNFLTIVLQRELPPKKAQQTAAIIDSLCFHYHDADREPEFTVQRSKTEGSSSSVSYKGTIMHGAFGYPDPSAGHVVSELREINDILDRMLAVKSGEISLLPGHTAHEWRVRRSRQRHKDSPEMAARVLVEEALACADASLFTNIPNPTKNHVAHEQTVLNGTVNAGSKTITFTNVLVNFHHQWVVTDTTNQVPTRPASIEIRDGETNITIRNDNDTLTFFVNSDSQNYQWTGRQYSINIFDACEEMVANAAKRQVQHLSRFVDKPSTVGETEIAILLQKMRTAKGNTKPHAYEYSVQAEKEDCIESAAHILHSLSVNPTVDPQFTNYLGPLLEHAADFCGDVQWQTSNGLIYCMEMIQAIDLLIANNVLDHTLLPACRAVREAAARSAGQSVGADARHLCERINDVKTAEEWVPHFRTFLYALDATGVDTGARGRVSSAFHNDRRSEKTLNIGHLLDPRLEDKRLRV